MRHPWFKMWSQDWLGSIKLRACTCAERGTLSDLMCVAHEHDPYGYFMDADTPEERRMLCKYLSIGRRTLDKHLASLLHMTRICKTTDGQMYIPRMVRDHANALKASELGKKGGNPALSRPLTPPLKLEAEAEADTEEENKEPPTPADKPAKKSKPIKKPYGEFGNVKLTDEEHAKLTLKHGAGKLTKGIDMLGDWMKSTGKVRKDHYSCLKETSWVWERVCGGSKKSNGTTSSGYTNDEVNKETHNAW